MQIEDIEVVTQGLDHLGLVASVAKELGIIEKLDIRLPISDERGAIVTMGERVLAMILNGLGFTNDRLYMVSSFFQTKPVSRLIASHVQPEHLNDDALGRCLDAIHGYGTTQLFSEIAMEIGLEQRVLGRNAHLDTSSISVVGDYETDPEYCGLTPAFGYSKDHRADLKQVVLSLTTTGKAGFPIWMESLDGNSSDKKSFHETLRKMKKFQDELKAAPSFVYVCDSAFYSLEKLLKSPEIRFITRVLETIKEAQLLCQTPKAHLTWTDVGNGYCMTSIGSLLGGVKQRWQLIFSEHAFVREQKTLAKKIEKERGLLENRLWHAGNKVYRCEADAQKAAKTQCAGLQYHQVHYAVEPLKKYSHSGKPKSGALPNSVGYKICFSFEPYEQAISKFRETLGRFILATNELDLEKLPDDALLNEYKQQSQVEGGFRFLKDPCFQVSSIFLKNPHRIEALMMVMTLCLMVYNMAQFRLRQALLKNKDTVPNQAGKPTQTPTMRWIFRMLLDVTLVQLRCAGKIIKESVTNLNAAIRKIIRYFGQHAMRIYHVEPLANCEILT